MALLLSTLNLRSLFPWAITLPYSIFQPMTMLPTPDDIPEVAPALTRHFITISDPRIERSTAHKLIDIIMIAICAVIAGSDSWTEIEEFGHDRHDWLRRFLELPNGIPSHDTFGRVFSLINPGEFQRAFAEWMRSVVTLTGDKVVAIDGKTNRRTFGKLTRALHLVSAFATANGVALGQVATDQKSNEITAIPELLKLLDISGCLITTDAMGCQSDIAADIIDRGGNYLLAVKGNQGLLYRDIKTLFDDQAVERETNISVTKGHGRIDKRTCEVMSGPEVISRLRHKNNWVSLNTVVKVTAKRTVVKTGETHTSTQSRYYICSLKNPSADRMQSDIRAHWGIENNLHWTIDMAFREDESRIRTDNAPANMATLRHIALNLIRSDQTRKLGVKASRIKAARNTAYLEHVLSRLTD
jgi:predicted transposase YbfD/YdcC